MGDLAAAHDRDAVMATDPLECMGVPKSSRSFVFFFYFFFIYFFLFFYLYIYIYIYIYIYN